MNTAAIDHRMDSEYAYLLEDGRFVIRLRTARGDAARVVLHYRDQFGYVYGMNGAGPAEMLFAFRDSRHDYFEVTVGDMTEVPLVCYYFEIYPAGGGAGAAAGDGTGATGDGTGATGDGTGATGDGTGATGGAPAGEGSQSPAGVYSLDNRGYAEAKSRYGGRRGNHEPPLYYGDYRIYGEAPSEGTDMFYLFPQCRADACVVPQWASEAVVYQIFPDRFSRAPDVARSADREVAAPPVSGALAAGGAASTGSAMDAPGAGGAGPIGGGPDTPGAGGTSSTGSATAVSAGGGATGLPVRGWDEHAGDHELLGGNLRGITERLEYLHDLGITVIYLTPIFASDTAHKYNTHDYYRIDPQFGSFDDLRDMVDAAHKRGIRVVLDGVFNHCGTGFFAFRDLLERQESSPYREWFRVKRFPVEVCDNPNYESFGYLGYMPKFATDNPEVVEYLTRAAKWWIREADIDGWRLDCAPEVDHRFWRAFRDAVKGEKPDALLVGEFWHDARSWLSGDQIDTTLNYTVMLVLEEWMIRGEISAETAIERFDAQRALYRHQTTGILWNLIGSHDTDRFLTKCGGDTGMMRMAVLLQMTVPGAPVIYYGDEVGMSGADPYHRAGMRWDEREQHLSLRDFYRQLIRLVRETPAFRSPAAEYDRDCARDNILAFRRPAFGRSGAALVAINPGGAPYRLPQRYRDSRLVLTTRRDGKLRRNTDRFDGSLPAETGVILIDSP